jgi:hypothetical protein
VSHPYGPPQPVTGIALPFTQSDIREVLTCTSMRTSSQSDNVLKRNTFRAWEFVYHTAITYSKHVFS